MTVAVELPAASVPPAASVQPVVLARNVALIEPQPVHFGDPQMGRKRNVALVLALIAACMIATVFLLSKRADAPDVANKPLPSVVAVPASPTAAERPSQLLEPRATPSASALAVPSTEHKAAPAKVVGVPRPAVQAPLPKASVLKIDVPPPPPPPPPPSQNKLELRRER